MLLIYTVHSSDTELYAFTLLHLEDGNLPFCSNNLSARIRTMLSIPTSSA
uniref:Uncharacterized protein n=1 Tax=Arundo donax TaxID=35708 RepID=A0A0A8ZHQ8_ARUDO